MPPGRIQNAIIGGAWRTVPAHERRTVNTRSQSPKGTTRAPSHRA